jgi:hypothetical protein
VVAGHHRLPNSLLPRECTVRSASDVSKCVLQGVFCEAVQHSLQLCLHYLTTLDCGIFNRKKQKNRRGEDRRVGWVGDDSNIAFDQNFLGEKEVSDGAMS